MKKLVIIFVLASLIISCNNHSARMDKSVQKNVVEMKITEDTLKVILDAFNRHDLDAIMAFFTEDCILDFPKGIKPWGQRYTGKDEVREALSGRFKGIPDVHYGDDSHWISADGKHGVSEWTLTGTATAGTKLNVRGCDLWDFNEGRVVRKNSFWKIVDM